MRYLFLILVGLSQCSIEKVHAGGVHQYQLNKRLELVEQTPATKPPPASNPVKKPETTPGDIQKRIDQSVQAQIDRAIREHHEKGH